VPIKDPQDVNLDYPVDWDRLNAASAAGTGRLAASETIVTSTWTVPAGLTKVSDDHTTTVATVWLSGGTEGQDYKCVNHIVTSQAREYDATVTIKVRSR